MQLSNDRRPPINSSDVMRALHHARHFSGVTKRWNPSISGSQDMRDAQAAADSSS
jgi:hypothetical protein